MKKISLLCLAILASVVAMSCTTFVANDLAVMDVAKPEIIAHFDETVNLTKFLGTSAGANIFNVTSENGSNEINAAVMKIVKAKGGSAAINVRVVQKASFVNMLLNGLTCSIYAPATVEISGDIIK